MATYRAGQLKRPTLNDCLRSIVEIDTLKKELAANPVIDFRAVQDFKIARSNFVKAIQTRKD